MILVKGRHAKGDMSEWKAEFDSWVQDPDHFENRTPELQVDEDEKRDVDDSLRDWVLRYLEEERGQNSVSKKGQDAITFACRCGYFIQKQPFQPEYIRQGMAALIVGEMPTVRRVMCKQLALSLKPEYPYAIVFNPSEPRTLPNSSSLLAERWSPHMLSRRYVYNEITVDALKQVQLQIQTVRSDPPRGINPKLLCSLVIFENLDIDELKRENKDAYTEFLRFVKLHKDNNITLLISLSNDYKNISDLAIFTDVVVCCPTPKPPLALHSHFFNITDKTYFEELWKYFNHVYKSRSALVVYRGHIVSNTYTSTTTPPLEKTLFHYHAPEVHEFEEWIQEHKDECQLGWIGAQNFAAALGEALVEEDDANASHSIWDDLSFDSLPQTLSSIAKRK